MFIESLEDRRLYSASPAVDEPGNPPGGSLIEFLVTVAIANVTRAVGNGTSEQAGENGGVLVGVVKVPDGGVLVAGVNPAIGFVINPAAGPDNNVTLVPNPL